MRPLPLLKVTLCTIDQLYTVASLTKHPHHLLNPPMNLLNTKTQNHPTFLMQKLQSLQPLLMQIED